MIEKQLIQYITSAIPIIHVRTLEVGNKTSFRRDCESKESNRAAVLI